MTIISSNRELCILVTQFFIIFTFCQSSQQENSHQVPHKDDFIDDTQSTFNIESLARCSNFNDWDPNNKALDGNSGRSKGEIVEVVSNNLETLRDLKRKNTNISGKIEVAIGINNCGYVDTCYITYSNLTNINFENAVLEIIKTWKFREVRDRPTDYIVVKYPFVFSN